MIKFFENAPFVPVEYGYEVDKILYKGKSRFQEIAVFENPHYGRMLVLDGVVQITERDEFFYHEMLAHVAMHAHPNPKKVVVIGGGDGGTVREALKHDSVEKVYFIEIDPEVIRVSKEFFPSVAGAVDDPRVEVRNMDGAEFIRGASGMDVILVDSTDPVGFARTLFSEEFFNAAKNALADDGIYVTQSESLLFHADIIFEVQNSLKAVFPAVELYTAAIATYPGNWWTFSAGSKKLDIRKMSRKCAVPTKYYAEDVHQSSFLPNSIYDRLMRGELKW